MKRYSGFIENTYRFETVVPTTIYDPKICILSAYKRKKVIDKIQFKLNDMPQWNVPFQAIVLCKKDQKTLEKKTEELIARLPEI